MKKLLVTVVAFSVLLLVQVGAIQIVYGAVLTHNYQFNGDFTDSLGGPSLENPGGGGVLTSTTYVFDKGEGLTLKNAMVANTDYSIEMCLKVGEDDDWRKLIDFKNLVEDEGFYVEPDDFLQFFDKGTGSTIIPGDIFFHTVLTRDGTRGEVISYLDGVKQFSFNDSSFGLAVFDGTDNIIYFLKDDFSTSKTEEASGTLDFIKIYDGVIVPSGGIPCGGQPIGGTIQPAPEPAPPAGGGCLIATATYGSELAPQVQQLRELRDNTLLQTISGAAFMESFNQFYYSFSPTIADWERQNPAFKEAVKLTITPLLTSLSILNYVDIDSEEEMLGYGVSLILLNVGMYFVAPAAIIIKIRRKRCKILN